jgi:benzoate membrane transport protein
MFVAGSWKPLGRWVAAIPPPLANAMLAGVLLGLCLAPLRAVAQVPLLALPVILAWAVMLRISRLHAVPVAVGLAAILIAATTSAPPGGFGALWPDPVAVVPRFDLAALIGIGLPLFIVTMASQNIPGIAVLNANGYRPDPGPLFRATGVFSLLAAPFGSHAVNLAAITAAICAGPDAHPDPGRRWIAAVVAGGGYVVFGLLAGAATALVALSPPVLIEAVAGLALLGAFANSLSAALAQPAEREAAAVTFLTAASGLTLFGIGGAFWGLLAGFAMLAVARWRAID